MNEEQIRNRQALRFALRLREDFQAQRKRMDNRLGIKADGTDQNIEERAFTVDDIEFFSGVSASARDLEETIEKRFKKLLRRFPIYTQWLKDVKGVGPVAAAQLLANIDIEKATTVSKIWQYTGMNPGMVRGMKRKEKADGSFELIETDTMIRGDKATKGFVLPFNKGLRTALLGVMGDGFIKSQNHYCMEFYYPTKHRLENSAAPVWEIRKAGAKPEQIPWAEAKPAHRHRYAIRKMVKMFLADLYKEWRAIEGLEVRPPYQEQYLGHKHAM